MSWRLGSALVLLTALAGCGGSHSSNGATSIRVETLTVPTQTETYSVPSSSMEPTLHCPRPGAECEGGVADSVVTQEPAKNVRRGDIVIFRTPPLAATRCGAGGKYLERVVGLPGDVWSERTGYVYINGKKLDEPYVKPDRRDDRTIAAITVPADSYFMMGDNRASSCDSRAWGTVPRANVIGTVVKILRPSA